MFLSVGKTV